MCYSLLLRDSGQKMDSQIKAINAVLAAPFAPRCKWYGKYSFTMFATHLTLPF